MFETKGVITESLVKEIGIHLISKSKKITLAISWIIFLGTAIFSFCGRDYKFAVLSVVLCIAIPVLLYWEIVKSAKLNLERMKEVDSTLNMSVSFLDNGIKITRSQKNETTVKYELVSKIIKTKSAIFLVTKANQFIVIFKNQINNENEFISYLKAKPTGIKW